MNQALDSPRPRLQGAGLLMLLAFCVIAARSHAIAHGDESSFFAHTKGTFTSQGTPPDVVSVSIDHNSGDVLFHGEPDGLLSLKAFEKVRFDTAPPSISNGEFTFTLTSGSVMAGVFDAALQDTSDPLVKEAYGTFRFTSAGHIGLPPDEYVLMFGDGDMKAVITFTDDSSGFSEITWEGAAEYIPEPHQYAVFVGLGLLGFAAWRASARVNPGRRD